MRTVTSVYPQGCTPVLDVLHSNINFMERLMTLYNIASPSGKEKTMLRYLKAELKRMGVSCWQDRQGNLYAVKGRAKTYPCVVAHVDEVHRHRTGTYGAHVVADAMVIGYDHRHKRMTGIGADDKNGIWVCLKCLEDFKVMKCAFFVQEENGCIGSREADMTFFSDCRFVLQCDRRGNSDFVTRIHGTELCTCDFIGCAAAPKYGYQPAEGATTDVYVLKRRGLPVSCANISCGYYEPHTDREYTILDDLHKCYRFVRHIVIAHKTVSVHSPEAEQYPFPGYYELFGIGGYSEEEYQRIMKRFISGCSRKPLKKDFI